jgi:hypothetical protein
VGFHEIMRAQSMPACQGLVGLCVKAIGP